MEATTSSFRRGWRRAFGVWRKLRGQTKVCRMERDTPHDRRAIAQSQESERLVRERRRTAAGDYMPAMLIRAERGIGAEHGLVH
jgi:hypothetical protein